MLQYCCCRHCYKTRAHIYSILPFPPSPHFLFLFLNPQWSLSIGITTSRLVREAWERGQLPRDTHIIIRQSVSRSWHVSVVSTYCWICSGHFEPSSARGRVAESLYCLYFYRHILSRCSGLFVCLFAPQGTREPGALKPFK